MSVTDIWRPKRPGPASFSSDRDNVTRQTLRAGVRAPPPEKPYINVIGGTGTLGIGGEALLLAPGHPSVKGVVRDKPVAQ